jgi:PAS domain S-box-containing protein
MKRQTAVECAADREGIRIVREEPVAEIVKERPHQPRVEGILARSPAIAFVWRNEPGWPVEYVSENVRKLGFTPDELMRGQIRYSDLVHPSDLPGIRSAAFSGPEGDSESRQRYRLRTAWGDYRTVDDFSRAQRGPDGRIVRIEGLVIDVTAQWEADVAVHNASISQAALNALLRCSLNEEPLDHFLAKALEILLGTVRDVSLGSRGAIFLLDSSSNQLRRAVSVVEASTPSWTHDAVPCGGCVCGAPGGQAGPCVMNGGFGHHRCIGSHLEPVPHDHCCFPIRAEGKEIGRVLLVLKPDCTLQTWEARLMEAAADVLAGAIERHRSGNALRQSEELFRALFDQSPIGVGLCRKNRLVQVNPAFLRMFGCQDSHEVAERPVSLFVSGEYAPRVHERLESVENGKPIPGTLEVVGRRLDGTFFPVNLLVDRAELRDGAAQVLHLMDVSDARYAEALARRHRQRLGAHQALGSAISSSGELRTILDLFLQILVFQLQVDAANILLVQQESGYLEFAASRGFQTTALQYTRLKIGDSYAGRAALTGKVVHIGDFEGEPGEFTRSFAIQQEAFTAYWGLPLIARGVARGVLEVFRRSGDPPPPDWLDSVQGLAELAAVAIDNAALKDDLWWSYEATIEGWAHALELRDRETEGHTKRVTDLAVRLAEVVGFKPQEIIHLRRGAILHDIGKMGIPDSILLKPGRLTPEEWEIMRMHPVYAQELLEPIKHLRPALDIPYAHHERWDGGGYPRGLRGDDIPLSARIFAVVDVWDALQSARPYKSAWPAGAARAFIEENAGSHFDPEITRAFLDIVGNSERSG